MTDQTIFWWGCFVVLIYLIGIVLQIDIPSGAGIRSLLARYQRAKLLWFLAAGISMALSVHLFFSGDHERGIFVGLWVPAIFGAANLLIDRER